jgi:cytochrome P450
VGAVQAPPERPALVTSMPEVIRWTSPNIHLRRTAAADADLGGKPINIGDKVVMWDVSGNRDEESIDDRNAFIIDRTRPRYLGFGVHRCVGNRLAEVQLIILWEEIMKRFPVIELTEEPKRIFSTLSTLFRRLKFAFRRERGVRVICPSSRGWGTLR